TAGYDNSISKRSTTVLHPARLFKRKGRRRSAAAEGDSVEKNCTECNGRLFGFGTVVRRGLRLRVLRDQIQEGRQRMIDADDDRLVLRDQVGAGQIGRAAIEIALASAHAKLRADAGQLERDLRIEAVRVALVAGLIDCIEQKARGADTFALVVVG